MTAVPQPLAGGARCARARLAGASLLALVLAACSPSGALDNPALGWSEAGSPKELEVERAHYRHSVHFATDSARLEAPEQDRLLRFLASLEPNERDTILLEGHADERASDLYNLELASRRAESVHRFLHANGFAAIRARESSYGERAPATLGTGPGVWRDNRRVDVVLERHVVVLPACPDWSRESGRDYANLPHSNFGCATQTNFGLMIANPEDLVRGRALAPADGVREAEAIARYRKGKTTELKEEPTK